MWRGHAVPSERATHVACPPSVGGKAHKVDGERERGGGGRAAPVSIARPASQSGVVEQLADKHDGEHAKHGNMYERARACLAHRDTRKEATKKREKHVENKTFGSRGEQQLAGRVVTTRS